MGVKDGYFWLPRHWLIRAVRVLVVGVGGSGSHVLNDLAVLDQTLMDLGHPQGLAVTVVDNDVVSEANVGRARFYEADVGRYKAAVLTNRVNLCFGTDWEAVTGRFPEAMDGTPCYDIVIGCVDTRDSRRRIWQWMNEGGGQVWLDLGNAAIDGQVVLGQVKADDGKLRAPTIVDLYPEVLDKALDPVDGGPSCSRAEALEKQSAFVNKQASMHAIQMLATLFREGRIDHTVRFFNVSTGRSAPLLCKREEWQRLGYDTGHSG